MKRYILIGLFAVFCLLPVLAQADNNMIINGGFEYPLNLGSPQIFNALNNTLVIQPNSATGVAVENANNLRVQIINPAADPDGAWETSIKFPISQSLNGGIDYSFCFTVTRFGEGGVLSGGIQDNRPPDWTSFFWTGPIDLATQPVGVATEYCYEYTPDYLKLYPALVFNLAQETSDFTLDNIRMEEWSLMLVTQTATLSGTIYNQTTYSQSRLYILIRPEGDWVNSDRDTIIVKVPLGSGGYLAKGGKANWSANVPTGKKYTISVVRQSGYLYQLITGPLYYTPNVTDHVSNVAGLDFKVLCNSYKTSTTFTTLQDACYK